VTLILDSEGLSVLARTSPAASVASDVVSRVRAALEEGRNVLVPAAALAELYRGGAHDQVVDACLSRFIAIVVVDTDKALARRIGQVLARAGRGSADHVDASVVAVATQSDGGLVVTGDVDDISALADGWRGVRVVGA
jgi:hypothetical protein